MQLINEIRLDKLDLITTYFECAIETDPYKLLIELRKYTKPLATYNATYDGINPDSNMHVFHVRTTNPKDLIHVGMWIGAYLLQLSW